MVSNLIITANYLMTDFCLPDTNSDGEDTGLGG